MIMGGFIPDLLRSLNKLNCQIHIITQNCAFNQTESINLWNGCQATYFGWRGGDIPLTNVMSRGILGMLYIIQYFYNGIRVGHKIAKEWNPDFIFAEWIVPSGLMAFAISKLTGVPYAARALGSDVLVVAKRFGIKQITRVVARNAIVLFADGYDLCKKTSELAGGKECHYAATSRKMDNKRSLFKPMDDAGLFTTCTVGRLHHIKGHDVLVDAAKILVSLGCAFRSYIVGMGEEYDNLRKQIQDSKLQERVILTGKLEDGDIIDLLMHVACVVIPSRSESISLTLAEAASAGRPVVVTDVGDMGYFVEKYQLGYVVPPNDPAALANAMVKISSNENRTHLAKKENRKAFLSLLNTDNAAKTIFDKLKNVKRD
jgi:glycosyltransferase involved in cell wall biosynthesis